jgi:hypothetical protein
LPDNKIMTNWHNNYIHDMSSNRFFLWDTENNTFSKYFNSNIDDINKHIFINSTFLFPVNNCQIQHIKYQRDAKKHITNITDIHTTPIKCILNYGNEIIVSSCTNQTIIWKLIKDDNHIIHCFDFSTSHMQKMTDGRIVCISDNGHTVYALNPITKEITILFHVTNDKMIKLYVTDSGIIYIIGSHNGVYEIGGYGTRSRILRHIIPRDVSIF